MSAPELLASAKRHFDGERTIEASKDASAAQDLFEKRGDKGGAAEALRVLVNSRRLEAERAKEKPAEADRIADAALAGFREAGEQKAIAVMLLAQAELNADRRGSKKRQKALEWGKEAAGLLHGLGEKSLEGETLLQLVNIYYKNNDASLVLESSNAALALFKELSDKRGEALALHGLALASAMKGHRQDAMDKAAESVELLRDLGLKKIEAFGNRAIAEWHLAEENPKRVLPASVVDSLLRSKKGKLAFQVATKEVERTRKNGIPKDESVALQLLSRVELSVGGASEDALLHAEEALAVARSGSVKDEELNSLQLLISLRNKVARVDYDKSLGTINEALALAEETGDMKAKAIVRRHMCEHRLDTKEYDLVIGVAEETQNIAKREGDMAEEGMAVLTKAATLSIQGDYARAVELGVAAKELFRKAADRRREGLTCNLLAEMRKMNGQVTEGMRSADEMRAIGKELADINMQVKAMVTKTNIHLHNEDFFSAEATAKELREDCKQEQHDEAEASALLLLLDVYMDMLNHEVQDAEACLWNAYGVVNEAGTMSRKLGMKDLQAVASFRRSELHTMSGRSDDAFKSAKEAQHLFRASGDHGMYASSMAMVANSLFQMGKKEEGRDLVGKALTLARECGSDQGESLALTVLDQMNTPTGQGPTQAQAQGFGQDMGQFQGAGMGGSTASSVAEKSSKIALDPTDVKNKLLALVEDSVGSGDDIAFDSALMDAGMDSLSSISFTNAVSQQFGLSGATSLVFDYPTLREITNHLVEESK